MKAQNSHQAASLRPEKPAIAKPATASAAAVKGDDPFTRTLTVFDMVVYGLISMVPIAPMAIYGGGVIARRLNYNRKIKGYEDDVTGKSRTTEEVKRPAAAPSKA